MGVIQQFANGLTPWFLRTRIFNAIRNSIVSQLEFLKNIFDDFRSLIKWKLFHNSQIVYLEHYLNDNYSLAYSPATRGADIAAKTIIWIESKNMVKPFLYNKIENRPKRYLYNKAEAMPTTYLKNNSEYYFTSNFIVWVPVSLTFNNFQMTELINFFKLGGKSFTINTY